MAWLCQRRWAEAAVSRPRLPGDGVPLMLCEPLPTQWGDMQSCLTPAQAWPLMAQSHPEARRLIAPLAVPAEGGWAGRHPGAPQVSSLGSHGDA